MKRRDINLQETYDVFKSMIADYGNVNVSTDEIKSLICSAKRETQNTMRDIMRGVRADLNKLCMHKFEETLRSMSSSCVKTNRNVRSNLKKATEVMKDIGDFSSNLHDMIFSHVSVEKLDKIPKELVPDIHMPDCEYLDALNKALSTTKDIDRYELISFIVIETSHDVNDIQRKYVKLCDRMQKLPEGTEKSQSVNAKKEFTKLFYSSSYKLKIALMKFFEVRKRILNRVLGITEKTYDKLGAVKIVECLKIDKASDVIDAIIELDNKQMEVNNG